MTSLYSIALVLYSLVFAVLARAIYSKLRSQVEFSHWLARYVGRRASCVLAPIVIALEATCLLLVLLVQGPGLIIGISLASAALLLVHTRVDKKGNKPCPCLGDLSVVWPKATRIALCGILVLALLVLVIMAARPEYAPSTDPLWVCAGGAILLLTAEGALLLKPAQRELDLEGYSLVRCSIESRLGTALPEETRFLIFFGALKCSACIKVAEEFAFLAKSSLSQRDIFLIDVGIAPTQNLRVGGARLIGLTKAVWSDLSVSATPALAVVTGRKFVTHRGAENCLRAITRLKESYSRSVS